MRFAASKRNAILCSSIALLFLSFLLVPLALSAQIRILPTGEYIDLKINGSDGPVRLTDKNQQFTLSWQGRNVSVCQFGGLEDIPFSQVFQGSGTVLSRLVYPIATDGVNTGVPLQCVTTTGTNWQLTDWVEVIDGSKTSKKNAKASNKKEEPVLSSSMYVTPKGLLSLRPPVGWHAVPVFDIPELPLGTVVFVSLLDDKMAMTWFVGPRISAPTLDSLIDKAKEGYLKNNSKPKVVKKKVAGREGFIMEGKGPDGKEVRVWGLVTPTKIYLVVASGSKKELKDNKKLFEQSVESIYTE
jgi:hypothetical protein